MLLGQLNLTKTTRLKSKYKIAAVDHPAYGVMKVEDYLSMAEKQIKIGSLDNAIVMLYALEKIAEERRDYILRNECRKRINKFQYKLELASYDNETGAASPTNREPNVKKTDLPKGQHKAYSFIRGNSPDPYRMSQISDLYSKMKTLKLIDVDQKDFINNFTTGQTTSLIKWIGKKNILHYVVAEWKRLNYIHFKPNDNVWVITSNIFVFKNKVGKIVPFEHTDLRKTKNPQNIKQDYIDIVETLNPQNASPNYNNFAKKEERRVNYNITQRENKDAKMKGNRIFDDIEED